jgi:threonylcarbamoyladenosine tRNA methylthiotransferase MtaB
VARGASRSRQAEEVITDVQSALDGGAKEIVLTGVHLGAWGLDFRQPRRLSDLVSALLARTSIPRLRLSSLEPWDLEADFFALWQDARMCRHLHLPLQSGSEAVLKRMSRKTTPDTFTALVEAARSAIPDVAIITDVIIGFPGETDAEFAETVEFVRGLGFAGGHVFTYSPRPGTPAARMKGQVRFEVRKERSAILREAFSVAAKSYRSRFLGQTMSVLWEATDCLTDSGWRLEGLTNNYMRVTTVAPEPKWNVLDSVRLIALEGEGLRGEINR